MMTHAHDNFPSDVFTVMEAAGASVTVGKCVMLDMAVGICCNLCSHVSVTSSGRGEYPLRDFLNLDMRQSVSHACTLDSFQAWIVLDMHVCVHMHISDFMPSIDLSFSFCHWTGNSLATNSLHF